jgi:hypothetical protein
MRGAPSISSFLSSLFLLRRLLFAAPAVFGAAIRLQAPDEAGRNFLSVHPRAPLIGLCM